MMGPVRIGPIVVLLTALTACAPAPSGRMVTGPGQGRADTVEVTLGTAPGQPPTPQTATVQTASLRAAPSQSGIQPLPVTAPSSPTGAELAAVTDILSDLQLVSFATNAEHCGYIGRDAAGRIITTDINRGTEASCDLPSIPPGMAVVASFHTHSTYSPEYASEWPTATDMMSDAAYGISGYISTPGGRLWYVDTQSMTVRQLCGRACLPQDPDYRPEDDGPLRPVMTLSDLQRWETG